MLLEKAQAMLGLDAVSSGVLTFLASTMQASIAAGYVEPSLGHVDNNGVDFGLVEIFHV
jgi:hypothetical protein